MGRRDPPMTGVTMSNLVSIDQPTRKLRSHSIAARSRWIGGGLFSLVLICTGRSDAAELAPLSSPLEPATQSLRADYRLQQWQRLARRTDRDSLIAAVLLGIPTAAAPEDIPGQSGLRRRLAEQFGRDVDARFALALACQSASAACHEADYYRQLTTIAPSNAVHWLLLPNAAAPDAAQLHAAATANAADSRLGWMIGLVRDALAGQPPPAPVPGFDAHQLALSLRRDAVEQLPLPIFGAVVSLCKAPAEAIRGDCVTLGRKLTADLSGTILSRMVGSAILRRLEKGSADEIAAKELRRDYVWMSQQLDGVSPTQKEQMQIDIPRVGEWIAVQNAVLRLGKPGRPPADWLPSDPQLLLLSEERTPVVGK